MTQYYPLFLDVGGRHCVVLGGGPFALEKVRGLLDAGAAVTVISAQPDAGTETLHRQGRITLLRRAYRDGDLAGACLAIDASGDPAIAAAVAAEARSAGALLNVVDRPEHCDWIAPALVRRDPLVIAVSTSGRSPYVAAAVRRRLEAFIGSEWAAFTALAGEVRDRMRSRGAPISAQRRAFQRLLRSDIGAALRAGETDAARGIAATIELGGSTPRRGRVSLVGAGPGDSALLTLAAVDALAGADVVFHDALVGAGILALAPPGARLVDVGKRGGRPSAAQDDIIEQLIAAARDGEEVVRLKGGDPLLFARGGEELEALHAAGIETRVIPGVSAALAAPAAAEIPLTVRGRASSVAVVTGHDRAGSVPERLDDLARAADTLVVLMPLANLEAITARIAAVRGAEHPAALIEGASLHSERTVRGTLATIAPLARDQRITSPATLVVGEVAGAVARRPGELEARVAGCGA